MSLTTHFLSLARARTLNDRIRALQHVERDKRFNADQQAEIGALLDEARRAPDGRTHFTLRPILNPSDVCELLVPLPRGEKPVLAANHEAIVEEWLSGWIEEASLRGAKVPPPGPLLLCGPTGCGKTTLTAYISARLAGIRAGVIIEAHKVIDSHMGESSIKLARAFDAANANSGLVVIEEIDALAEARTGSGHSADRENNRISVGMMRLMELSTAAIIATTNRADALDPALLRRFEYKIEFPMPDADIRRAVLSRLMDGLIPKILLDLPLTDSIPRVARIRRLMTLRNISAEAATAAVLSN